MALSFCPKCGSKIFEDANFCANCGESMDNYRMPQNEEAKDDDTVEMDSLDDETNEVVEAPSKEDFSRLVDPTFVLEEETLESEDVVIENQVEETNEVEKEILIEAKHNAVSDKAMHDKGNQSNEKIKILGMKEWAFYTILLCVGVAVVVSLRYFGGYDDATAESANEKQVVEAIDGDSAKLNVESTEVKNIQSTQQQPTQSEPAPQKQSELSIPQQSGSMTDEAFHVIVSSIKELSKAEEEVKKYPGAYIIPGSFNKIAVYRSLKKEDAQLYLDSVAKKTIPDAWLFHGKAK